DRGDGRQGSPGARALAPRPPGARPRPALQYPVSSTPDSEGEGRRVARGPPGRGADLPPRARAPLRSSRHPHSREDVTMEPLAPETKKPSPWTYVGCTCGAVVLLIMFAIVGMTFFTYRMGKNIQENFSDPVKREAKTREILAYKELPAGYHPVGGI